VKEIKLLVEYIEKENEEMKEFFGENFATGILDGVELAISTQAVHILKWVLGEDNTFGEFINQVYEWEANRMVQKATKDDGDKKTD